MKSSEEILKQLLKGIKNDFLKDLETTISSNTEMIESTLENSIEDSSSADMIQVAQGKENEAVLRYGMGNALKERYKEKIMELTAEVEELKIKIIQNYNDLNTNENTRKTQENKRLFFNSILTGIPIIPLIFMLFQNNFKTEDPNNYVQWGLGGSILILIGIWIVNYRIRKDIQTRINIKIQALLADKKISDHINKIHAIRDEIMLIEI